MSTRAEKGWAPLARRLAPPAPRNAIEARKKPVVGMGTVRFRLHELAVERGWVVKHGPHAGKPNRALIQRMTGLGDDPLFYILRYPETVRHINFRTLARLCHGLNCTPGDLLVYDSAADSDAPLSELYKQHPELGLAVSPE